MNTGGITSTGNIIIEADNDITIGTTAGTAITAAGGANVTITADKNNDGAEGGKITVSNNAVIALATTDSDVSLKAGDGIGTDGAKISTTGLTDFAAATTTGGIFVSNATSGAINVTTLGAVTGAQSTTSGAVSITNAAAPRLRSRAL